MTCLLVTTLLKRPGEGSLIHGGTYEVGGLFELACTRLGYKVSNILSLNISLVNICEN